MTVRHLPTNEVHVLHTSTRKVMDDEDEAHLCRGLLSPDESARWRRYVREVDRREFLVSHALLRLGLSRYVHVEPAHWAFTTNCYGRPEVSGPPGARQLRFNLSRTRGLVACAICWGMDIGVDVEDCRRVSDLLSIARTAFAEPELANLRALPQPEMRRRFFEYWTLKEAYIKARGMGLHLPLDRFHFSLSQRRPTIVIDPRLADDAGRWQFKMWSLSPHHQLAVAVRPVSGENVRVVLAETRPAELAAELALDYAGRTR